LESSEGRRLRDREEGEEGISSSRGSSIFASGGVSIEEEDPRREVGDEPMEEVGDSRGTTDESNEPLGSLMMGSRPTPAGTS